MEHAIHSVTRTKSRSLNFAADPPITERFTRLQRWWDSRDRRWVLLASVDGTEVELTADELFNYQDFRSRALEQRGLYLPRVSEEAWEELVELRIKETGGEWTV
jgi:hypothetical protein